MVPDLIDSETDGLLSAWDPGVLKVLVDVVYHVAVIRPLWRKHLDAIEGNALREAVRKGRCELYFGEDGFRGG